MTRNQLFRPSLHWMLFLLLFSMPLISGCTGCAEDIKIPDISDSTPAAPDDQNDSEGDDLNGALNDLGNALKDMGEAISGEVQVEPVDWRDLGDLIPDRVRGMDQVGHEGERTGALGFKIAKINREFESEDGAIKLSIEVIDLGSIKGAARLGVDWLNLEVDRETNNGFERTAEYKDHPVLESCDTVGVISCEVNLFVAERFVVKLESEGMEFKKVRGILDDVNVGKLEDMKDHGVSKGV